jgi:hypothetical protein
MSRGRALPLPLRPELSHELGVWVDANDILGFDPLSTGNPQVPRPRRPGLERSAMVAVRTANGCGRWLGGLLCRRGRWRAAPVRGANGDHPRTVRPPRPSTTHFSGRSSPHRTLLKVGRNSLLLQQFRLATWAEGYGGKKWQCGNVAAASVLGAGVSASAGSGRHRLKPGRQGRVFSCQPAIPCQTLPKGATGCHWVPFSLPRSSWVYRR